MSERNDGRIVSVQVGEVRTQVVPAIPGHDERQWRTAYYKDPVSGPVRVARLGLEGDDQCDRRHHGGPDRALLGYAAAHYARWSDELKTTEIGPGGFGENLTISGHDEANVCLGDTYAIGGVRVQVTQPRGPCSNISRRWQRPGLLKRVTETMRFGWYLRVLEEGEIAAGMDVRLVERRYPEFSVARVFELKTRPRLDPGAVARLARCPELTPDVRAKFVAHATMLGVAGPSTIS